MALFGDYSKAGKGVAKDAPKKKALFRFLELYFRKFWKLLGLNILTFICCIPIITIGPAIAGMTRVIKLYSMEKHADVLSDFWNGFSKNWKQSLPMGIIDTIVLLGICVGMKVYPSMGESTGNTTFFNILCVLSVSLGLTFLIMNFFIFPMIVSTNLPLMAIIKNAFYLTCLALKTNVITLLIYGVTIALIAVSVLINPLSAIIVPIWPITFLGYVSVFNSYPVIQKYVIDPYYEQKGEENPEYAYLKPLDPEDSVFVDRGGSEAPIGSKSKKGKTIS